MSNRRELLGRSLYLFLVYFISLPLNRFLLLAKLIKNKISQKIPEKCDVYDELTRRRHRILKINKI